MSYFWEVDTSTVTKESKDNGKTRIEYTGAVFPASGPVTNGAAPAKILSDIYFTADGQGDYNSDLLNACKKYLPPYLVTVDGGTLTYPGAATTGDPIRYGSQDSGEVPDPNIVLMTTTHPYFAGQVAPTPPPVTTHPTPPPTVTPPLPVPPGGTGRVLPSVTVPWPKDQALNDFTMGGQDSQDIETVVDSSLTYDPTHTGAFKVVEYGSPPHMIRLMIWVNDVGVYGMDQNEPLGTRPDVSYTVGGVAPPGGLSLQKGDRVRQRIENHGDPAQGGSCRWENLSPSRY